MCSISHSQNQPNIELRKGSCSDSAKYGVPCNKYPMQALEGFLAWLHDPSIANQAYLNLQLGITLYHTIRPARVTKKTMSSQALFLAVALLVCAAGEFRPVQAWKKASKLRIDR